ncbi:MAG: 50S ribosomal protein L4 [Desulfobacteraceae bacterium]|nr:MAG: 50S ribosomal protein L4 [Desulfobacteraceae bacterium]
MAVIDVQNIYGDKVSEVDLPDSIFNVPVKSDLLHEVVKMQLASKRSGTACVKNRSDVAGSTRKLFRQKGTGRARRGDIKSPTLRGGGVVFGPHPKNYAYTMPKKKRRLALKMALSSKRLGNSLFIIDKIELPEPKTQKIVEFATALKFTNALILTVGENTNLELSARNIPGVKVMRSEGLNVYDILKYHNLILLEGTIKAIEGRLSV